MTACIVPQRIVELVDAEVDSGGRAGATGTGGSGGAGKAQDASGGADSAADADARSDFSAVDARAEDHGDAIDSAGAGGGPGDSGTDGSNRGGAAGGTREAGQDGGATYRDADVTQPENPDSPEAGIQDVPLDFLDRSTCDITRSPSEEPCLIAEAYGVFVSPLGDDLIGRGTRLAPYQTLTRALHAAAAEGRRVYACDDPLGYREQVELHDGAKLYGGFRCIDWSYGPPMRMVVRAPASPSLTIRAASAGVIIEDAEIISPDGTLGGSSIGALITNSSNVVLRRVKVVAGHGGQGLAGAHGGKGEDGPLVTTQHLGAAAWCPATVAGQLGGSWPQPSSCGSRGGAGGTATQSSDGTEGVPGNPRANVSPPDLDNGGLNGATGGNGGSGSPGKAGATGIAQRMIGSFSDVGYAPAVATSASAGTDGYPGQGGGGGGASNATNQCIGASGGAGGMGGCGGMGGVGGGGGGASVAVLSWTSALTLDTCELVALIGGPGGKGGNGGDAGQGRPGATGGSAYTVDGGIVIGKGGDGGPGGNGGIGGPGAGGTGGPSYALVFRGQQPVRTNITMTLGTAGMGGPGGTSGIVTAPNGLPGEVGLELSVP